MKKVGVILAGSGHLDGSEIREAVLTLLAIDKLGATSIIMAPNKNQFHVMNHIKREEGPDQSRNMMEEAARIARGEILDISNINYSELDAIILPGGFGVAKNLCNFAFEGEKAQVLPEVKKILLDINMLKKPIGAICISPALLALIFGNAGVEVTIGSDKETAALIKKTGAKHIEKKVTEAHVDKNLKIVSTPAYMCVDARLSELAIGIENCVREVLNMCL